jgi:hypothetical protein
MPATTTGTAVGAIGEDEMTLRPILKLFSALVLRFARQLAQPKDQINLTDEDAGGGWRVRAVLQRAGDGGGGGNCSKNVSWRPFQRTEIRQ